MAVTNAGFVVPLVDTLSRVEMKQTALSPDKHVQWEFVLLATPDASDVTKIQLTLKAQAKAAESPHDKKYVQAVCKILHTSCCSNCRGSGYTVCNSSYSGCVTRNGGGNASVGASVAEGPLCKNFYFSVSGSVSATVFTLTSRNDGRRLSSCVIKCSAQHFKSVAEPALLSPCDSSVVSNLEAMLQSGRMSDVTFVVGGEEIRAHSLVLGAASDVFEAMFQHDTEDRRTGRVTVKDVGAAPFKEMLRCVYTDAAPAWGTGEDADDLLMGIFFLAEKYNLDALRGHCQRRILSTLTEDNVVHRIQSVNIISPFMVPLIADPFVRNHLTDILASPEWSDLMAANTALAADVMFNAMKR